MELLRPLRFTTEKNLCRFFKSTDIVELEAKECLGFSILGKGFSVKFFLESLTSFILRMSTLFLEKDISTCPKKCCMILDVSRLVELGWMALVKDQVFGNFICS